MGLFIKVVGGVAKAVGKGLVEAMREDKSDFQEANWDQLGTFENGVLTISEGHTTLEEGALDFLEEEYDDIREIIFPSTLREIEENFLCGYEETLEKIDFSKVHLLEEIPEYFINADCHIEKLVIPVGVKIVGEGFASSDSIKEVYLPYTVEEVKCLNYDGYEPDVYIYSSKLTDIEDLCSSIGTLYVPEEMYLYYLGLVQSVDDTGVRLRKMPADKLNFYESIATPLTEVSKDDNPAPSQPEPVQAMQKSPGNLFSDALEELINSVAESDELTEKKKEIVLRRAVKEGEDPDEVEMVLEARFFEAHNK